MSDGNPSAAPANFKSHVKSPAGGSVSSSVIEFDSRLAGTLTLAFSPSGGTLLLSNTTTLL